MGYFILGSAGLRTSFFDDFTRLAGFVFLGPDWAPMSINNFNVATNSGLPFRVGQPAGGTLVSGENTDATDQNRARESSMVVQRFRPGGNQFAELVTSVVIDVDSAGSGCGPVVLHASGEGTGAASSAMWQQAGYGMLITNAGGINLVRPQREVVVLDTAVAATVANGDTIRLRVTVGGASNLVEGLVNGVVEVSAVDADANRPNGLIGTPGMFCSRAQGAGAAGTAATQVWASYQAGLV